MGSNKAKAVVKVVKVPGLPRYITAEPRCECCCAEHNAGPLCPAYFLGNCKGSNNDYVRVYRRGEEV